VSSPSLYAKKFDLIMSSMSYTAERVKRVGFSIPYAEASQALLIRLGRRRHDQDGRRPRRQDHRRQDRLARRGTAQEARRAEEARLQGSPHVSTTIRRPNIALGQNRVDVVFNTVPTLAIVLKGRAGQIRHGARHRRAGQLGRPSRRARRMSS